MASLLDADLGMSQISRGEILEGKITSITHAEILIDVGAKSEGVITGRELEALDSKARSELQVGQDVLVYVMNPEDEGGNILLSLTRAQQEKDWRDAEEFLESQDVFKGAVAGFNKGGLIVKLGRVRGFVPASQMSAQRRRRAEGETPDQKWGKMVNEPIMVKVVEVDRSRNRLIFSERAAAKETREAERERLLSELKEGDIVEGRIISLAPFGAFVDVGGADGLVHLSELTWKRIEHPNEILKVGQTVKVQVLGVDKERKRIALSMKRLEDDPWSRVLQQYKIGQLVEGTVTKLTKFGAFARIKGNEEIEGLIHVSELSDNRISHPKDAVQEGQTYTLRIVKIEPDKRRIGLSLKEVGSARYVDSDWAGAESPDDDEYGE
ncbi:MAG TPA: S1 RNA-binding domain-containing protein [Anaerolineales bacterium]|nr:S1 RNA-binding domain-containing protein [Anaerolineales bacterium]